MKSKRTIGIILALTATLGLILTACEIEPDSDSEPAGEPKTIRITGFPASTYSGRIVAVTLLRLHRPDEVPAVGGSPVSNVLYISLHTYITNQGDIGPSWRGTGNYVVLLMVGSSDGNIEKVFIYSEGKAVTGNDINLPTYPFTAPVSTVSFSEFYDITTLAAAEGLI
jgi:hypothetical protein